MARDISNNNDVIDSRDIIARIEELEGERDSFTIPCASCMNQDRGLCRLCDNAREVSSAGAWASANEDDAAELAALTSLASECEGSAPDWKHGETLIRDSYFRTYAEELADDIGAINADDSWPNNCIDWDRAARELQMDYAAVDFDGVTYWVR